MSASHRSHAWNAVNIRPRSGDLIVVGRAASVQFDGPNAINVRVIRLPDRGTYQGWAWIDGYRLDAKATPWSVDQSSFSPADCVPSSPRTAGHRDLGGVETPLHLCQRRAGHRPEPMTIRTGTR